MPIRTEFDENRRIAMAWVVGDLITEEMAETLDRVASDPRFKKGFSILSDHTEVGEPLTPAQARELAAKLESLAATFAGVRWAVITSKPASFGMIRMLSALVARIPIEIQAFMSRDAAETWLSSQAG